MGRFGKTYISRYQDPILRNEHGWDAPTVLESIPDLRRICSAGSSVGINENQLALRYPDRLFTLLDPNRTALQIAETGEWDYEHLAISPDKVTASDVRQLIARMCDPNHFSVTRNTVKRATDVPNMKIVVGSLYDMPFEADSFDLVMAFNALQCGINAHRFYLSEPYRQIQRILRRNGHLLNEWGLFRFTEDRVEAVIHDNEWIDEHRIWIASMLTECVQSESPTPRPSEYGVIHHVS